MKQVLDFDIIWLVSGGSWDRALGATFLYHVVDSTSDGLMFEYSLSSSSEVERICQLVAPDDAG